MTAEWMCSIMTDDDNYWMPLGEVLEEIIKRTGKSRRQAKRMLLKSLRSGELTAVGHKVDQDGRMLGVGRVPAEFWQGPWEDEEGDSG
jgi:hypothetical protein